MVQDLYKGMPLPTQDAQAAKEQVAAQQEKSNADKGFYPEAHQANGVWDGRPVGRIPTEATKILGVGSAYDPNFELRSRLRSARINAEELEKAVRIVDKNPEFLDFLWLVRSGLV